MLFSSIVALEVLPRTLSFRFHTASAILPGPLEQMPGVRQEGLPLLFHPFPALFHRPYATGLGAFPEIGRVPRRSIF